MMAKRGAALASFPVDDDFEPAGLTLAQRREEANERRQQKQSTAKPEQRLGTKETICLARRGAPVGVVCNPWHDHGNYSPLADWIAKLPELSAGDKRFHAACLRRWLNCKRRLPVDKLATETGTTSREVKKRIRKFVKMGLMGHDRFGKLQLLYRHKERDAEYGKLEAGEEVSRIANEVMAADLPDAQVIVYGRLCGMACKRGWCWKTNAKLAEACGFGRWDAEFIPALTTLRTAVRGLEKAGLIRVDRPGKGKERCSPYKKHGGGANVYHFLGHDRVRQNGREL